MILQRYILRELVVSFVLTCAAVLSVMVVGALFQLSREYTSPGLQFLAKAGPTILAYIAPYAILVAGAASATLSYGRLAADNEVDAMRASGYPVTRILLPALWLGLALAAGSYAINEYVAPAAHYHRRILIRESVISILESPPAGPTQIDIGPHILSYQDARGSVLDRPVVLRTDGKAELLERYVAQSGRVRIEPGRPLAIVMERLRFEKFDAHTRQSGEVESFTYEIDIEEIFNRPKRSADMSREELLEYAGNPRNPQSRVLQAWMEYYGRYARSAAAFLLVILGACVGIVTRKGSRLAGLGAALPSIVGYFVLWAFGEGLGEKGRMTPPAAALLAEAALVPLLAFFVWRILRR